MRALVTGAAGFVGSVLARRLLAAGTEVHVTLRESTDPWRLEEIEAHLHIHRLDLADTESLRTLVRSIRPHDVFHLATHGGYSWQSDEQRIIHSNVLGTASLVDACIESRCQAFVNAGSSSEYGYKDHSPSETEVLEPNSAYAVAKAFGTNYCSWSAAARGLPAVTLRLYSAYGPWEDPRRLVPALLTAALAGRLPRLVAPDTSRDFVYVDDVVEAFVSAAAYAASGGTGVYNVGSGRRTTLRELVELVRRLLSVEVEPVWNSMVPRAWDTSTWISDPSRAKAAFGWRARTELDEGLLQTASWLETRRSA